MKKNKVVNYVLAGALSFGILGGASLTALAATNSATTKPSAVESSKSVKAPLDSETQKQVETIMNKLKADLAELGVTMPEKGPKGSAFANLDDETKAKAEAIMEKVKSGELTHKEGHKELEKLGIERPERGKHGGKFANLDDETKAKAEAIMEKVKSGELTHEEGHEELEKLGIERPEQGKHGEMFANLDDETKAKAEALVEKAQEQLAELGVDHVPFKGMKGEHFHR